MNTSEYQSSIELTKQYLENPVGYSSYEATSAADKQLIRQNNVIICLLEHIIHKLNGTPVEKVDKEINDLITKIDKLNIGMPSVKKTPSKSTGLYTFGYK